MTERHPSTPQEAKQLYFVRHGKVENPDNVFYGTLPGFRLSEQGVSEIQQSAEFLSNKAITTIYSGPLERVRQTAEIVRERLDNYETRVNEHFTEVYTNMEGCPIQEVADIDYDFYTSPPPTGNYETIEQILSRMQAGVAEIIEANEGNVCVAIHGDPLMVLKASLEKIPVEVSDIRPGHGQYVKHGEVFEGKVENNTLVSLQTVFTPNR